MKKWDLSENWFLLTLDSGFEVCTSVNSSGACSNTFARLLTIDLTLWQVKVEISKVEKYNVGKKYYITKMY